jgi:hypothetical protein
MSDEHEESLSPDDIAPEDAVPAVEVRPRRILIDGRASDLPEALRMIAEQLSRIAGDVIQADRLECTVDLLQAATTSVFFKISAWRATPLT